MTGPGVNVRLAPEYVGDLVTLDFVDSLFHIRTCPPTFWTRGGQALCAPFGLEPEVEWTGFLGPALSPYVATADLTGCLRPEIDQEAVVIWGLTFDPLIVVAQKNIKLTPSS